MSSLLSYLDRVPDSRVRPAYPLSALLSLCIVGFMCGRTGTSGIARLARQLSYEQLQQLGFKRCTRPVQHTISRVFSELDCDALESVLAEAGSRPGAEDELHHLALDGKRLCGSISENQPRGVHLVALFSQHLCAVQGQQAAEKGNEITAAIALLRDTDLAGTVVTGDAMFAQQEICQTIRDKGGHYVMALKDNQKLHKRAAERAFSPEEA